MTSKILIIIALLSVCFNVLGSPQETIRNAIINGHYSVLQKSLAQLGYDPGPIDGIFGNKTEIALTQYYRDRPDLKPITVTLNNIDNWYSVGGSGESICQISLGRQKGAVFPYTSSMVWRTQTGKDAGFRLSATCSKGTWNPLKLTSRSTIYGNINARGPHHGNKTAYNTSTRYKKVQTGGSSSKYYFEGSTKSCTGFYPTASGYTCAQWENLSRYLVRDLDSAKRIIASIHKQKQQKQQQAIDFFKKLFRR